MIRAPPIQIVVVAVAVVAVVDDEDWFDDQMRHEQHIHLQASQHS